MPISELITICTPLTTYSGADLLSLAQAGPSLEPEL